MTNKELGELLLLKLLEIAETKGYDSLTSLQELAKDFGEIDSEKVYKVSKFLHDAGFIEAFFTESGEAFASISGKGAIIVENGGETGIIQKYKTNQINFIMEQKNITVSKIKDSNVSIESKDVTQSINKGSSELEKILEEMSEVLKNAKNISGTERDDAQADLEMLRAQMKKSKKDKSIVSSIIEGLGKLAPLLPLIPKLTDTVTSLL